MATAKVTLTLSPDEHRIVRLSLDCYAWAQYQESQKARGQAKQTYIKERDKTLKLADTVARG